MAHSINGMAERFADMLASPGVLQLPGCYDVFSAMVLDEAGFPAVFLSGYGFAASFFGNPDIGLTTLTETALLTKNVTNALNVPLVVDADNGYGNEDNVVRTVHELEHAGAAAMVMEDQVMPKRCGHTEGKKVLPLDEYMKKLECALKGRKTPMKIVARTDASPVEEAIRRATCFHAAGADVTLIDGLKSLDEMKRVGDEVPGLKQINLIYGGKTPMLSASALHDLGFKVVLYSTPALYLTSQVLFEQLRVLKETGDLESIASKSTTFGEFQRFIEGRYIRKLNDKNIKV
ncbi:MAG TPA: isocitrate lyase/PEP mutase family protein [Minicystis sp.]|nr:isocitrate lyase/PEP mutase family protein [Minicystis sp.]